MRPLFQCLLATTTLASSLYAGAARALPAGAQVSGGEASIATRPGRAAIVQSSQRAIINWSSFNVSQGETVQFQQPNASSITLNRIRDTHPSVINGSITANGQVWLVNPQGIAFGKNAQVNVGGLLATASDIADNDFMAGRYNFSRPGNANAAISNAGNITTLSGGLIALAGPNVSNSGIITARLGKAQMASGDIFTVDLYGDGLINLQASPAITRQLVSNSGLIQADGGKVLLTAAAAETMVNSLINLSGIAEADSVGNQQGSVTLYAAGGAAQVSGMISASGKGPGQAGGAAQVLGDNVALLSGSMIDASGDAGGGYVKIGGDFHGGGNTPTARTTAVETGAVIDADALTSGDGGKVAVWSDQETDFGGSITARGDAISGNGGYVETSGHNLIATGTVNAGASHGNAGTWLLDPNDITISQSSCTGTSCSSADTIGTSLSSGSNVTIATSDGNITLSGNITDSGAGTTTLTFRQAPLSILSPILLSVKPVQER